ncbi:BTB domain-containing protein, partial [Trichostrongylus colubriformis]
YPFTDMGTEILSEVCYSPAPSSFDRPFRLHVQDRTFLIDAECMRKISPIFSVMCYGKDFEGGRELSREIVDEKCTDIDVFLRAVHDPTVINATNFPVILRLSHKYQVLPVIETCQDFIKQTELDDLKPDEVMTLLITAYDFHCKRDVLVKLIHRLATEGNTVFARLKISRYLPAQMYGAVISASMNIAQLREYEGMNGHCLKMERSKTKWRNSVCEQCKSICDRCATCDECKKSLCKQHVQELQCVSNYGKTLIEELKNNIVEVEWTD